MTETTTTIQSPTLADLAKQAASEGAWWEEKALDTRNPMELPTRVMVALENAGIHTVADLKRAGPHRLRELDGVGKQGFDMIVELLRAYEAKQKAMNGAEK